MATFVAGCTSSSGDDGSTGDDDSGPGDDVTTEHVGSILVSTYEYSIQSGDVVRGGVTSAQFIPERPSTWDLNEQGCTVIDFPTSSTRDYASAGAVRLATTPSVTLTPGADSTYMPVSLTTPPAANSTIDVAADGDEVPGFTGTIVIPPRATLISPNTTATTISRATDYEIRWTGGSGLLSFDLYDTDRSKYIVCLFPASAGRGTVPADLLSQLAGTGGAGLSVQTRTTVIADNWGITLMGTNMVVLADGTPATLSITFQ